MMNIHYVSLLDILPPVLAADLQVRAATLTIDEEHRKITEQIKNLALLYSLDNLPEAWVDELAWQCHVDFYDTSLPLEQKRELVKKSDAWHRRKGTPSAVEELINTVFGDGKVEEWFEYEGSPYHFRVVTNNSDLTSVQEKAAAFVRALQTVKNTRSKFDSIVILQTEDTNLYLASALHMGERMTIEQVV